MIRVGFWGIMYYKHNKEPQHGIGKYRVYGLGLRTMQEKNAYLIWHFNL